MKMGLFRYILTCMVTLITIGTTADSREATRPAVTLQAFYDELSPYGTWLLDPHLGYVWIPDETDFHPYYSNGYWEMTEYGNTWVSLYPWGWAPFHYGRWTYDPFYGWIWIPGFHWAPAWVCWRYGGGFYAWAPLGPWIVISVTMDTHHCPYNWWVFTPHHFLYGPRHHTHFYVSKDDRQLREMSPVTHTAVDDRSNVRYPFGPTREEIFNLSGIEVPVRQVREVEGPRDVHANEASIGIYRPQISEDIRDVRPGQYRNATRPVADEQPLQREAESPEELRPGDERRQVGVADRDDKRRVPVPVQRREPAADRPVIRRPAAPVKTTPATPEKTRTAPVNPGRVVPDRQPVRVPDRKQPR